MKIFKNIFIIIIFLLVLYWFYNINEKNYKIHRFLLLNKVNHPEYIPDSQVAKINSFWFKQLKADIYWLETIQYIGSNAVSADYKKYLYKMINLITDLSPNFEKPYFIWELLLPDYNPRYEKWTENEKNKDKNILEAEKIWLKWIKNFCDLKKVELIKKEYNIKKIQTEKKYKNPCKSYKIPFNLAYIYFFYKHDSKNASDFYKVTSAIDNSPQWASILAAIMQGRTWDRIKAISMFINMINPKELKKDDLKIYNIFSKMINWVLYGKIPLNKNTLEILNNSLKKILAFSSDEKNSSLSWEDWKEYIRKSIRELNLYYIEQADKKYFKKYQKHSKDARELYDKWFLDYFPIDYQQYDDYWIAYIYDEDIKNYNAKMANYTEKYFKWFFKSKKEKK